MLSIKYRKQSSNFPDLKIANPKIDSQSKAEYKKDRTLPQPFHCTPWKEANKYHIDLPFPYDSCIKVVTDMDGETSIIFDDDLQKKVGFIPAEMISNRFFGICTGYNFETNKDVRLLIGGSYTDRKYKNFIVEGIVETHWYSKSLFVVYRVPEKGGSMTFAPGDSIGSLIPVFNQPPEIEIMDEDESWESKLREYEFLKFSEPPHHNLKKRKIGELARPYFEYSLGQK